MEDSANGNRRAQAVRLQTFEPGDHSFRKHFIVRGSGDTRPKCGSTCQVIIQLLNDEQLAEDELGNYKIHNVPSTVTLGEGVGRYDFMLDGVIMTMVEGEGVYVKAVVVKEGDQHKCTHWFHHIEMKRKGYEVLMFNITLESIQDSVYDDARAEELAKRHFEIARQSTCIYTAIARYKRALLCLGLTENTTADELKEVKMLTFIQQCIEGLVECYVKRGDYLSAIEAYSLICLDNPFPWEYSTKRAEAYWKLSDIFDSLDECNTDQEFDAKNEAQLKYRDRLLMQYQEEKAKIKEENGDVTNETPSTTRRMHFLDFEIL